MSYRHRSRSRSPISRGQDESRSIHICNLPRDWGFDRIKDFIKNSSNDHIVLQDLRYVDVLNPGECLVRFSSPLGAIRAAKELDGLLLQNRRLQATVHDSLRNPKRNAGNNKYSNNDVPVQDTKPQQNDEFETYGLSLNFLNSLGMSPPLVNRIFVNNLDPKVTEEKIHEVFGMAGKITNLILIRKNDKVSAKIEYDHPVEAVQAVAMFHGHELYDKRILTRLDTLSKEPISKLPQGLKSVGTGLGANGQPMRDVRINLQLQALKQELCPKMTNEDAKPFENQMNNNSNPTMCGVDNANQYLGSLNMNNLNPQNSQMLLNAMFNGMTANNTQIWGSMMQNPLALALQTQNAGLNPINNWKTGNQVMMNAAGMMPVNMDAGDLGNHNLGMMAQTMMLQGNQDNSKRRFEDRDQVFADDNMDLADNRNNDEVSPEATDMVVFTNLPPSVSHQVLKAKMREVGDFKFVEMNGQGRAIVRFYSARDGERCQKMFNKCRVDGQVINVNYF